MKSFVDRLIDAIEKKKSRVVVGLDPRLEMMPPEMQKGVTRDIEKAGKAILDFNVEVIEAVAPHAVAVKPQIAFYEKLGPYGIAAYFATCKEARDKGLLVIGDVKRGDVPETAKAYAEAHFTAFQADAITVNPLFGSDGIEPFLQAAKRCGGGLFVLVKTSNPTAGEIQDLPVDGKPLYLHLAEKTAAWGEELKGGSGYSSVGAVVGATRPQDAERIRAAIPKAFFLVPGYGAQGAGAAEIKPNFNPDGLGAIVNASRSVIFAYDREPYKEKYGVKQWAKAVEEAAAAMKNDINAALGLC